MDAKEQIKGWDNKRYPVRRGYPPEDVRKHCVLNAVWQAKRLSMKGKPTHEKLQILQAYWDRHEYNRKVYLRHPEAVRFSAWMIEVQVGNYLGALRRGGQLDENNQIRKYI